MAQPGFVPPPYPYERIDRFKPLADRIRRRADRLLDRHTVRSAARGGDRRARRLRRRTWLSAEHRLGRPARARCTMDGPSIRHRRAAGADRGLHRDEGVRRHAAAVAATAPTRPRHDPVPGDRVPHVRDGGDPRRLPWRFRLPMSPTGGLELDSIDPGGRRVVRSRCGSTARATRAVCSTISAAAAAWGRANGVPVFSDECYVEFTWTGRGRTILEHGLRRRRRGALAVEAIEPRRAPGSASTRGDAELVALPPARSASTSA